MASSPKPVEGGAGVVIGDPMEPAVDPDGAAETKLSVSPIGPCAPALIGDPCVPIAPPALAAPDDPV